MPSHSMEPGIYGQWYKTLQRYFALSSGAERLSKANDVYPSAQWHYHVHAEACQKSYLHEEPSGDTFVMVLVDVFQFSN